MDEPATETFTEWRVTGDPGPGYPPYDFTWSPCRNPHLGDSETAARKFVELVDIQNGLTVPDRGIKDVRLCRRTVTVSEWQEVPRDGS